MTLVFSRLNPRSLTLGRKPWTLEPRSLTLGRKPWTLDPRSLAVNPGPWSLYPNPPPLRVPAGEVKAELVQVLTDMVSRHQCARAQVTEDIVDAFMAVRPMHVLH